MALLCTTHRTCILMNIWEHYARHLLFVIKLMSYLLYRMQKNCSVFFLNQALTFFRVEKSAVQKLTLLFLHVLLIAKLCLETLRKMYLVTQPFWNLNCLIALFQNIIEDHSFMLCMHSDAKQIYNITGNIIPCNPSLNL